MEFLAPAGAMDATHRGLSGAGLNTDVANAKRDNGMTALYESRMPPGAGFQFKLAFRLRR
jgi:hypothetical protein